MNQPETTSCPICDKKIFEEAYGKVHHVWSGGHRTWDARQVVCKNCGLIHTNPRPSEDILTAFYSAYMRYGNVSPYFREKQIKFLADNFSPKNKTLLDIGAFNGQFIGLAKDKGFKVKGIEPSAEESAKARSNNLDVSEGYFNLSYVENNPEKYDVITILHVLEHIERPLEFLELALRASKKGGYIYIEVPDTTQAFAENIADFFSIQHLNHFTPGSLRNLASQAGVEIVKIEQESDIWIQRVLIKNTAPSKHVGILNEFSENVDLMKFYVERRERFLINLKNKIEVTQASLYGAGEHTSQLISSGVLDGFKILAITDSNPKKWGLKFEGFTILPPTDLPGDAILISSYDYQEEIAKMLEQDFPELKIIKLYSNTRSYDGGI
jgi:2-polyprenyl-3-methyl-5-hydroxy-6-metoxy-1,4-benzoquinol methylase